jgi:hypothetical protein
VAGRNAITLSMGRSSSDRIVEVRFLADFLDGFHLRSNRRRDRYALTAVWPVVRRDWIHMEAKQGE